MSFASSMRTFAAQAAAERQTLSQASVQPYTVAGATDGAPVDVFLSAVRAEREIAENGFVIVHKATLRVLKTCSWQPVEGAEFVNTANAERFRCNSAIGADSDLSAEIVCEVVRISP